MGQLLRRQMQTLRQACQVQVAVFIKDRYINIIIMKQFENITKSSCTNKKLQGSFELKSTFAFCPLLGLEVTAVLRSCLLSSLLG